MNPYESKNLPTEDITTQPSVRGKRGPALYIASFGLLSGFIALPFLAVKNPVGLLIPIIGCIGGGLKYRHVSCQWAHDPKVPQRQMMFSAIALVMGPIALACLAKDVEELVRYALIGFVLGTSVTCGIIASGTRRYR